MKDLERYERVLKERLAELESRLHRIDEHMMQPLERDWEDHAQESEMDEVLEGLGQAGNTEIEAIHAALQRIETGAFGVCIRCGEDISEARLAVLPQTSLCRTCAAKVAKAH